MILAILVVVRLAMVLRLSVLNCPMLLDRGRDLMEAKTK